MKLLDIFENRKYGGYTAYVLDDHSRQQLAKRFPPKFPQWIGHHITYEFGVPKGSPEQYGVSQTCKVVGYAEGDGIEALVVAIGGVTTRPDGKTFHITWSLDRSKGRKPVDSNKIIEQNGYTKVDPIVVHTTFEYLT